MKLRHIICIVSLLSINGVYSADKTTLAQSLDPQAQKNCCDDHQGALDEARAMEAVKAFLLKELGADALVVKKPVAAAAPTPQHSPKEGKSSTLDNDEESQPVRYVFSTEGLKSQPDSEEDN